MNNADEAQLQKAVQASIPQVGPRFWAFRIMVACGMVMLLILAAAFY
ncbi:cytochrome ubiquinol oxidase subunit I, partial [Pseudoalteromonas ruthenica]